MKYSVILKTCRKDPKFEWFFDSYYNEVKDKKEDFELIIIDSELWSNFEERNNYVKTLINDRFKYIHSEPKPTNWQGPYRKTKYNYFDAANSVNTGLILCNGDYVIFFDDCSLLVPGVLDYHIFSSENGLCGSGTFLYVENLKVKNGIATDFTLGSSNLLHDTQKNTHGGPRADWCDIKLNPLKIGGGWWMGSNSSAYFDSLLECDGSDEFTARYGCEDIDLGCRLYNKNQLQRFPMAFVFESMTDNDREKSGYEQFPIRCFSKDRLYDEQFNKLCTDKFHEIYYKENGGMPTPMCEGSFKRSKGVNLSWCKFDLKYAREYYKTHKQFLPTNNLTHCPFSNIPIELI